MILSESLGIKICEKNRNNSSTNGLENGECNEMHISRGSFGRLCSSLYSKMASKKVKKEVLRIEKDGHPVSDAGWPQERLSRRK